MKKVNNPQTFTDHLNNKMVDAYLNEHEVLHTQWEIHGPFSHATEIHPINDPDGLIIIADVYKPEDAELICKAVNSYHAMAFDLQCLAVDSKALEEQNKKLLDSNRELKTQIKLMYDLTEQMGMYMTSDQWTEQFRSRFNPIMTNAENLIK